MLHRYHVELVMLCTYTRINCLSLYHKTQSTKVINLSVRCYKWACTTHEHIEYLRKFSWDRFFPLFHIQWSNPFIHSLISSIKNVWALSMKSASNLASSEMSSESNIIRDVHFVDDAADERDQVTRIQAHALHIGSTNWIYSHFLCTSAWLAVRITER